MAIKFECQSCQQSLEVEESMVGENVECPVCHESIVIPESSEVKITQDTRQCPHCGESILSIAKKCKHCQASLKRKKIIPISIATVILLIGIISAMMFLFFKGGDKTKNNSKITSIKEHISIKKLNFRNEKYYMSNSDSPFSGSVYEKVRMGFAYFNILDGKQEGESKSYYGRTKDNLKEKNYFKNGKEIGPKETYSTNGQLLYKFDKLKDGKPWDGKFISYFDNGQLKSQYELKKGEKEGKSIDYERDGKMSHKITYKNGIKDGRELQYHDNGQLKSETYYSDGELNGKCICFHKNGTKASQLNFKLGLKVGKCVWYYENGKVEVEEDYTKGKGNSSTIGYFEDGSVKYIGQYKNGKKQGLQQTYISYKGKKFHWDAKFDNGKLLSFTEFIDSEGKPLCLKLPAKPFPKVDHCWIAPYGLIFYFNDGNSNKPKTAQVAIPTTAESLCKILGPPTSKTYSLGKWWVWKYPGGTISAKVEHSKLVIGFKISGLVANGKAAADKYKYYFLTFYNTAGYFRLKERGDNTAGYWIF